MRTRWDLMPRRVKRPGMLAGGDGSTLSLDFTSMGETLDSRLTFTRASDATFVNSSGLVQYADANHVQNSTMLNNTGSKWNQTTSGGSVTINGDGTVRFNGTGGRATWLQSIGSLSSGLPMTFSFRVTSFTNTNLRTTDLFNAGTGFTGQSYFYTDTAGTTHTLTAFESLPKGGTDGVGTYSVTATTSATTGNIIFGSDCNGVGGRSGDVTIADPQLQYGTVVPRRVYVPNSSIASAKWDAARFDHDPTSLSRRGLLIEGSATNLLNYSQDVTQSSRWTIQTPYASISANGGIAPDNTNTANLCTESTGSAARSIYQAITPAAGTYTVSVWAKAGSGSARFIRLVLSSAAGNFVYVTVDIATGVVTQSATAVGTASAASATVTPFTQSWYRIALTGTLAAAANFIFIIPTDSGTASVNTGDYGRFTYTGNGSSFLLWGAQVEAGSGASSHIPTGASTVQRAADSCSIPISSAWFNTSSGTFLANWRRGQFGTQERGVLNTDYVSGRWLGLSHTSASNTVNLNWWSGAINRTTGAATNKAAYAYGQTTGSGATLQLPVRLCLNGSAVATGTFGNGTSDGASVPNPSNFTNLIIGAASSGAPYVAANRDWLNNCISSVKYWPTVLPDATLQSLTQ